MNKLKLVIAAFLASNSAHSGSLRTIEAASTEGFFSNRNLVTNAGFESNNKAGEWVASAGTLSTTTTTPGRGNVSGTWDASATSQTLKSKLVAIPAGMYGKSGVVSVELKCATGTCTHTLSAYDGSADISSVTTISSSTTTYAKTAVGFIFPTSGSIQLLLTSAANEPLVNIDNAYIGLSDGVVVSSVTTNSSSEERVERVRTSAACTSTPCTIASQSGTWVSSWSRASTGNYTVNFVGGMFSAAPTCVCTSDNLHCAINATPTTSAFNFVTYNAANSPTDSSNMSIICMGPK